MRTVHGGGTTCQRFAGGGTKRQRFAARTATPPGRAVPRAVAAPSCHDPLNLRCGAGVEERFGAEHQCLPWVLGRGRGLRHPLHCLCADLHERSPEQLLLAASEVVVQRPPGNAGKLDDLLGADGGVSPGGEQLARGADQRRNRRLALGGLGPRTRRVRRSVRDGDTRCSAPGCLRFETGRSGVTSSRLCADSHLSTR
jgi:hypothetical protein